MALNPCNIILIVIAAVVIGIIIVFLMNQQRSTNTVTLSSHTGPTTVGQVTNRVVGSGVTCGSANPLFTGSCGPDLVCSDKWRICVAANTNNPATCGPNSPCNPSYVCADNNLCVPDFIPDPNVGYVIRAIPPSGQNMPDVLVPTTVNNQLFIDIAGLQIPLPGRPNPQPLSVGLIPEIVMRGIPAPTSQVYRWRFIHVQQGNYYAIINSLIPANTNLNTMTVSSSRPATLLLGNENWDQNPAQRFTIQPSALNPGAYAIVNPASNLALTYNPSIPLGLTFSPPNWDNDSNQLFIFSLPI